jgi:hypothetical protein
MREYTAESLVLILYDDDDLVPGFAIHPPTHRPSVRPSVRISAVKKNGYKNDHEKDSVTNGLEHEFKLYFYKKKNACFAPQSPALNNPNYRCSSCTYINLRRRRQSGRIILFLIVKFALLQVALVDRRCEPIIRVVVVVVVVDFVEQTLVIVFDALQ